MKISVLMPVYNSEKYIKEAIDSILNQTLKDFEFIIINDGSTDLSENIIKSYDDKRIKYYKNEVNEGLIYTLNKGLKLCNGKYIARMDSDDISMPNRLKRQVDFLEKNIDIDIVGSWIKIIQKNRPNKYYKPLLKNEEIKINMFFRCEIVHPTVMYRKSTLNKLNKIYDDEFKSCEDYELWNRILPSIKIANIDEVLLNYRIVNDSITRIAELDENRFKRDELHKKIYMNILKNINMNPTRDELKIHRLIAIEKELSDESTLILIEKYLNKIINYNLKENYIDKYVINKQIGYWWYRSCRKYKYSVKALKLFRRSNLRKYYTPNLKEYLAFFKKY